MMVNVDVAGYSIFRDNRDNFPIWTITEVDCDITSGRSVKTIVCYVVASFEVASSNGFLDIKKHFVTGGGGHRR